MSDQTTTEYQITGMTCGHCVMSVDEALRELDGVAQVEVDLHAGAVSTATVTSAEPLDRKAVETAIQEAGYGLVPA